MTVVGGCNFSGRSRTLRNFAWSDERGQYLHPDLELNQSGLAGTVAGEALLHGLGGSNGDDRALSNLSGGERAQLVLDCALGLRPQRLAIDCVLEQLDPQRRTAVLERLAVAAESCAVMLADNFIDGSECARPGATAVSAVPAFNDLAAVTEAIRRAAGQAPSLELRGLSFAYVAGRPRIFEDATHRFEPGRIHLLAAPNGAGKSTLARLLVGLLQPDGGSVAVGGRPLDRRVSAPLFYLFQNARDQVFGRSIRDYLDRVKRLAAWRTGTLFPAMPGVDFVGAFGLGAFAHLDLWDVPPVALKRVGLAAAFCSGAPWLFLDEPTLGLDQPGREMMGPLLSAAAEAGRGLILVTHRSEFDALPLARQITIARGRIVDRGQS